MNLLRYPYFIYSIIFLIIWSLIWLFRKDLRKKLLFVSIILCPIGPISEIWYFKDYWAPLTITKFFINIEDLIFTFALGGITYGIYKIVFNLTNSEKKQYKSRIWFIFFALAVVLGSLTLFSSFLKINSVVVTIIAFCFLTIIIWRLRKDLIVPSLISGLFISILFFIIYQIMFQLVPNLGELWCKNCNPSGIVIYGLNIEEFLWDFSWGVVGGVFYEMVSGYSFTSLSSFKNNNVKKILSNFNTFDNYRNGLGKKKLNSSLDILMSTSTQKVLLIRITRKVDYYISKLIDFPLSADYAIFTITISPLFLDLPFFYVNFHTAGTALCWVLFYTTLTYCLLKFSQTAWLSLIKLTEHINNLLATETNKKLLIDLINKYINLKKQIISSFITGIVGITILYYLSPFFSKFVKFGFASYFQVFLNAFLGMNAVYLFWVGTLYFYRVKSMANLSLCWYSPADTPAISELSALLASCALKSIVGLVLLLFPLFYYINKISSPQIVYATSFIFSLSISAAISITFFPQYWLIQIVKKQKDQSLAELRIKIDSMFIAGEKEETINKKIALYHNIRQSPDSVMDINSTINYLLSVTLTFAPYLLKYVIKILKYTQQ
ncbi:MAG: hypothetical protein PHX78_07275 [bacterium]|nr:hypothetical protein [bacterium]